MSNGKSGGDSDEVGWACEGMDEDRLPWLAYMCFRRGGGEEGRT